MSNKITTYQELLNAKKKLKEEITSQELEFQNNKFVKFTTSMDNGESIKDSLLDTVSSIGLKDILTSPLGSLLSTYLLSNKKIRKYFIAYSIVKETIPYAFNKLKNMLNEIDVSKNIPNDN